MPSPPPPPRNLSAMHRATAARLGPRVELRFKRDGLFHDLSWNAVRRQADSLAASLIALGVEPGDRVAILSENRVEWVIADLAILAAGAVSVPMHAPLSAAQAAYQLDHSGAVGLFVSGEAQLAKIEQVRDDLVSLRWIASFDPVSSGRSKAPLRWNGLIHSGRDRDGVLEREARVADDDLATIIYTSGTTGRPKGVMLTQANLTSNVEATTRAAHSVETYSLLTWLPFSHIYARTCDLYLTMLVGSTLILAESPEGLRRNLIEVEPTDLNAVPRFYEKVWSEIEALDPAARSAALRKVFGSRVRRLSSGGAPLPRHIAEGFLQAGLPLLEGYGMTECSPVVSFNRHEAQRVGTVGMCVEGVEIQIADDGEILTRGPHVMQGYWRDPEATAATIVDGWLHTGDVGSLDDAGFLTITDRKKDLIVTSSGKNVAPSELERLLAADPYIDQAVAYGDHRPFVTAVIVPNLPLLAEKALELTCPLEIEGDLIRGEAIREFMAGRVATVMEAVSKPERVRAFLLLGRPLRAEADELTATQKVRRRFILSEFQAELDKLYSTPTPN